MNRKNLIALLVVVSLVFSLFFAFNPLTRKTNAPVPVLKKIVLDAGHGGKDRGASVGNAFESAITLNITLRLAELLRAFGFEVYLTRETDDSTDDVEGFHKALDIKNRVKLANKHSDALFLSIHINTFPQESVCGIQLFHGKKERDKHFAQTLRQTVIDFLQKDNDRPLTKVPSGVYIFKKINNVCALAECGFLTNNKERALLVTDEYCEQIALTLFAGIMRFYEENNAVV